MPKKLTWNTVKVKLGDLKEWDKNPVKISERDARELAKSIDKFEHVLPYVAAAPLNGKGKKELPLLDGHQRKRVELTLRKGVSVETVVDVRVPSRALTEKERAEIAVRLRKNTGQFDDKKLLEWFEADDLLDWGFDQGELEDIGFEFEDKLKDAAPQVDRADELLKKWKVKLGDCFSVGSHRLICGDNTDEKTISKLLDGESVDIVWTDPPYGISYKYKGYEDKREGYFLMMEKAYSLVDKFLSTNAAIYIKQYTGNLFDFQAVMPKRWRYKNLIIWKNNSQAHPKDNYDNAFEIIYEFDLGQYDLLSLLYLEVGDSFFDAHAQKRMIEWVGTKKLDKPVRRGKMWNIWDDIKPLPGGFMRSEESLSEGSYKLHSCQTLAALPLRSIEFSSKPNDVLLDIYCGSGTTLVACQNSGRRGRGAELSPAYVAVTLQRMQDAFGITGVKVKDGKK